MTPVPGADSTVDPFQKEAEERAKIRAELRKQRRKQRRAALMARDPEGFAARREARKAKRRRVDATTDLQRGIVQTAEALKCLLDSEKMLNAQSQYEARLANLEKGVADLIVSVQKLYDLRADDVNRARNGQVVASGDAPASQGASGTVEVARPMIVIKPKRKFRKE